ncbi:MAG: glycosyltransferase family 39 protein [Chloroflexota bacterium]|nr:glycosyltransferase family 39 protein [Chloroflexota bacterium]
MRRDLAIALVLFGVALWAHLAQVTTTSFHRDEARWIHRARFVANLSDPLGDYWHDRDLMRGQPPLGSYLMGVGLLAQGRDTTTNGLWNFSKGELWNQWQGRMPTREDLIAARRTDSVVGALIAVVAFCIGRRLSNRLAGVAAALLLIPHPLSLYLSSLAGSDAILTLLVGLAALVAIALAERPAWSRAVLLGVLLGLGGATKLSPLLLALPLAGLGVVLLVIRWRGEPRPDDRQWRLGWMLLSQPATAAAAFVAAYPYLWADPVGRSWGLFQFRAQEMQGQGEIWKYLAVESRIDALGRVGFWLAEFHSTTGWLATTVAAWFGQVWHPIGIDLLLALVGAEILLVLVVRHGLGSRYALAAAILGGQVALIVLGMRADFERYLYPVLLASAVCGGLTISACWRGVGRVWSWWRSRQVVPPRRAMRRSPAVPRPMVAAVRRQAARVTASGQKARPVALRRVQPTVAQPHRSSARQQRLRIPPARGGTVSARTAPVSERVAASGVESSRLSGDVPI